MGIHHKFAIFPDICYFCSKPLLNCNLNFYLSVSVHFYDIFLIIIVISQVYETFLLQRRPLSPSILKIN